MNTRKLFLLSAFASLAVACDTPRGNATTVGANRGDSAVVNRNANAETFNTLGLNENAYTTASNSELGNFKPSVGKTASEIKLWQNKLVAPRLRKLMGADYATMKKFWNTETPIKKYGDVLMMTGCEQHNCATNMYVIFMSTAEGNMNVVHIGEDTTKEWNEGQDIDLPPPFAEELVRMKSHK